MRTCPVKGIAQSWVPQGEGDNLGGCEGQVNAGPDFQVRS